VGSIIQRFELPLVEEVVRQGLLDMTETDFTAVDHAVAKALLTVGRFGHLESESLLNGRTFKELRALRRRLATHIQLGCCRAACVVPFGDQWVPITVFRGLTNDLLGGCSGLLACEHNGRHDTKEVGKQVQKIVSAIFGKMHQNLFYVVTRDALSPLSELKLHNTTNWRFGLNCVLYASTQRNAYNRKVRFACICSDCGFDLSSLPADVKLVFQTVEDRSSKWDKWETRICYEHLDVTDVLRAGRNVRVYVQSISEVISLLDRLSFAG